MRRIKIVCTIGPSSQDKNILLEMVRKGMNVARLNFSHGDHSEHLEKIRLLREVEEKAGECISILQDLAGPKIRIGEIRGGGVNLERGEKIELTTDIEASGANTVYIDYPYLSKDVNVGDVILLADGNIELQVTEKRKDRILCTTVVGGFLGSHQGVSFPKSTLSVETFTEKDQRDLVFGLENGVDIVALSFVRNRSDIAKVREFMDQHGKRLPIVAKIERREAIENIDEIIGEADGIMVARGDLGVEVELERVPILQKMIIKKANEAGKPVITATQMLRSMIRNPRPTRAEVCDVANAIFDGTDCLMLSEETASGEYPIDSVGFMGRIADVSEAEFPFWEWLRKGSESLWETRASTEDATSHSATVLAKDIDAVAIVASTASGMTARLVSRFRPECPIIAVTPYESTLRSLNISWGVLPVLVPVFKTTDDLFDIAAKVVLEKGIGRKGQTIVITAGVPVGVRGKTNLLRAMEI